MKEIKKEKFVKTYESVWVANDGTEFSNAEECKKYDESAKGVLFAKYRPIVVKESDEYEMFGGSDDNIVDIVKLDTAEKRDLILQILLLENPYYKEEQHTTRFENIVKLLDKALAEKDFVFIYRGYDRDCFGWDGSLNGRIEEIKKVCEESE